MLKHFLYFLCRIPHSLGGFPGLALFLLCLFCSIAFGEELSDSPESAKEPAKAELTKQRTLSDLFAEYLKVDLSVLENNPNLVKACTQWKSKIDEATSAYIKKLELFVDREKTKGDLETINALDSVVKQAKEKHNLPCILFDRLSGKPGAFLLELNKAKSRANKAFIGAVDKEISAMVRQKDIEAAKKLQEALYVCFVPKSFHASASELIRRENQLYFVVNQPMNWFDANDWCRERHGELFSIGSPEEHVFFYRIYLKQEQRTGFWSGGYRQGEKWFWSDGKPFAYQNWSPENPSGGDQDRLAFGYGPNGTWDDNWSKVSYPFIIQWTLY